ncbi:NACHT domain-containing protein [Leptothermofonsia sp. ETS-13]|uniref:NACHT domain-containing protein n=1 Tax=Leptothermofonsia sp. ETS-13 TaxID=3035696 RepID=UPI003BA077F7
MSTPDPQSSQRIEHSSIQGSQIQQGQAGENLTQIQAENLTQNYITVFGRDRSTNLEKLRLDLADRILRNHIQPELKQRLRNTIYQEVWLNPELEEQPRQVGKLPLNRLIHVAGKPAETLDLQTTILEVFAQYKKLLILGEPGIGKTTTLLTLADQLVEQAIANPGKSIPVVFELSAWKDNDQSIEAWLIQQLTKMRVSARIAKGWLKEELLIPLVDGLDELKPTRQEICVQWLNQFAEYYPYLVVCCRAEEYEAGNLKLNELRSAVRLQPLTPTQIQGYLKKVGQQTLWEAVETHAEKQVFLHPDAEGKPGIFQIPLFLKIAAEVGKPFAHQSELLEAYIDQRLSRDVVNWERRQSKGKQWAYKNPYREPNRRKTNNYLSWLALYMKHEKSTEFMIEEIALDGLISTSSILDSVYQLYYLANRRNGKVGDGNIHHIGWIYVALWLSMTGIPPSLFFLIPKYLESEYFNSEYFNSNNLFSAVVASIVSFGLCFAIGDLSSRVLAKSLQYQIEYRNQKSIFLIGFATIFLIILMITGSLLEIYGLFDNPQFSGLVFIPSKSSILLKGIIYSTLGITIFLVSLPSLNFMNGWLPEKKAENLQPNQRIHDSFKRFLATVIPLSLPEAIPLFSLLIFMILNKTFWFYDERILNFLTILGFSTFFGLMNGGMACVKHFSIRLVLCAIAKVIPWNYARFLDYCVERRLLQRIGGRYRFLHRELLEHFADKAGGVS